MTPSVSTPSIHPDLLTPDLALKIELRDRLSLKPLGRKARTHTPEQIESIARSIRQFGFINPVLIDDAGAVLAGHARLAAAERLGLETVPVVTISHLTSAEKRAFVLADNRLAELAGWDKSILADELRELRLLDPEFSVTLTGFTEVQIDALVFGADAENASDDAASVGPPASPVNRLGDLWRLGEHRIFCGDATKPESYAHLMGDDRARAVFTDPPYNVPVKGHVTSNAAHREFPMAVGEMSPEAFTQFLADSLGGMAGVCVDGAVLYAAMDWRHAGEMIEAAGRAKLAFLNVCVWDKGQGGMGSLYRSQHEFVFVFKQGEAAHLNNVELGKHGRNRTNVWSYPGFNSFRSGGRDELAAHPTPKPVNLVKDALLDCTSKGDIVLDPFSGGGSTLIAAEKIKRRARVMELDPGYVDAAILRWEAQTGKAATHAETGRTFLQTKADRLAPSAAIAIAVAPPARVRTRLAA
jgi:DNA modification methylase